MKKRQGTTLVEILIAMIILSLVIPVSLSAFGDSFMIGRQIYLRLDSAAAAEWWFNMLELPVSRSQFDTMPVSDPDGRWHFSWAVGDGEYDSLAVALRVEGGSAASYTVRRIY